MLFRSSINMFSNSKFMDVFSLKPFNTIGDYITNFNNYNTSIVVKFFLTNFLLFIPLALILGINDISKKISLTILITFPIVLELLQAWFRIGVFDIDAILINILSSMFVLMLSNRFAKKIKIQPR